MSAPALRRVCAGCYETTDGAYEVRKVPAGEPEAGRWVWKNASGMLTGSGDTKAECVAALAEHIEARRVAK